MFFDSKPSAVRSVDLINIRRSAETFDAGRNADAVAISHSTRITKGIGDKLAGDQRKIFESRGDRNDA